MSKNNKKKYVKEFFKGLEFNPSSHTYNYDNKKLSSVSSVIKKFVEPFDADKIAGFVARKKGVTKEVILQEWENKKNAACSKGNRVHDFGEQIGNFRAGEDASKNIEIIGDGYEKAVLSFWDSIPEHIEPFLMELQMFSPDLSIAGTADIILYNTKTGKFVIADYKTNIDLFKNYRGKKMLPPFQDLLDCPYNKYQLQLSFYQILFEQCGYEVEDRKIIWLMPDGTFKVYRTKNFTETIKNTL